MKKILFIIIAFAISFSVFSQVQRKGNTFTSSSGRSTRDTLVTKYTWEDSKGVVYPIIINKANGHCYVIRTSKNNGKKYRMYFDGKKEEIGRIIAKELGIPYKETAKKK